MGDDGYSINDLPKVTATVSSELISRSDAFDMMIRFLSNNNSRSRESVVGNQQEVEHQHDRNSGNATGSNIHHYWEDLYHVAETLTAKRTKTSPCDSDPQQVALRSLRLAAAITSVDSRTPDLSTKVHQRFETSAVKSNQPHSEESYNHNNIDKLAPSQENSAKMEKKQKKKEKKRKREN
jgi:hypothetical protein